MPSTLIVVETANGRDDLVFLTERLTTVELDDPHFAGQLVERLNWAGADAECAARRGNAATVRRADGGLRLQHSAAWAVVTRDFDELLRALWRPTPEVTTDSQCRPWAGRSAELTRGLIAGGIQSLRHSGPKERTRA
jgi:hypothetical protein